jgi:hypothetical protein
MSRPKTGQNLGKRGCDPHNGDLHGSLLSIGLRVAWARDRDLSPPLERALRLLHSGDAKDVLQLALSLVHPVSGGHKQGV